MDRKKIKELITKTKSLILRDLTKIIGTDGEIYKDIASDLKTLDIVLVELSKSDWISVEDELPPYDEYVWVTNKDNTDFVMKTSRTKSKPCWNIDKNGFLCSPASHVTHWKPIEKLEE